MPDERNKPKIVKKTTIQAKCKQTSEMCNNISSENVQSNYSYAFFIEAYVNRVIFLSISCLMRKFYTEIAHIPTHNICINEFESNVRKSDCT